MLYQLSYAPIVKGGDGNRTRDMRVKLFSGQGVKVLFEAFRAGHYQLAFRPAYTQSKCPHKESDEHVTYSVASNVIFM